jgi:hypothetical protein
MSVALLAQYTLEYYIINYAKCAANVVKILQSDITATYKNCLERQIQ